MTPALVAQKCREKTAAGNVFRRKARAKQAASNKRRSTGADIRAFRCACCRLWHIGTHTPRKRPVKRPKA